MRIIFGAYRDWGMNVMRFIAKHPRVTSLRWVMSADELERVISSEGKDYDMVLLCGWSWQASQSALATLPIYSEHPCERDEYSLGTPLQGQISDGITRTKHRIVKIGYPELVDRQYSYEVDMNLTGNMQDILDECESTAKTIYSRFLDDYPNVEWKTWPKADEYRVPRKPHDSEIKKEDLQKMTVEQLWNKIRMLEDPYPNAFIEDETGTIHFKKVSFKSKK